MTAGASASQTDDVVALGRLQSRYADVVTRRSWSELGELFMPESTVHLDTVTAAPRLLHGPAALGDFIAAAVERFDHFVFTILSAVVDVDPPAGDGGGGDSARGRMFICEVRHEQATDAWHNAYGVYQDRYRKVDGRWLFAERHYRSMARTGEAGAVFGVPPGLGPLG